MQAGSHLTQITALLTFSLSSKLYLSACSTPLWKRVRDRHSNTGNRFMQQLKKYLIIFWIYYREYKSLWFYSIKIASCFSIISISRSNCFISASIRSFRFFFGAVSVTTLNPWYWWWSSSQFFFKPKVLCILYGLQKKFYVPWMILILSSGDITFIWHWACCSCAQISYSAFALFICARLLIK